MRLSRWRRAEVSLVTIIVVAGISGCGWRGLNSLPLTGTQGRGPGSFAIQAQMPDVDNLQPPSGRGRPSRPSNTVVCAPRIAGRRARSTERSARDQHDDPLLR